MNLKTVKSILFTGLLTLTIAANAQHRSGPSPDSISTWIRQNRSPLNMDNYEAFIRQAAPLLRTMNSSQIVGLGETTHGTSEFQTLRYWLTRYLCEMEGFTVICLENSYGWTVTLNQFLQTGEGNLDTLMKQNLLGMWQHAEMKEMLQWMRKYNEQHERKLQLVGMDYSATAANAEIIQQITGRFNCSTIRKLADTLQVVATFLDNTYSALNSRGSRVPQKVIIDHFVKAYELTARIKALADSLSEGYLRAQRSPAQDRASDQMVINDLRLLNTTLYHSELAYYTIYGALKDHRAITRDETMASMVKRFSVDLDSAKVVVLAHQAHLAKQSIFGNAPAERMTGGWLHQWYGDRYVVLGTATFRGTCSITGDRFITPKSKFKTYTLTKAPRGSWEDYLMQDSPQPGWLDTRGKRTKLPARLLRFAGYRKTGTKSFYSVSLNQFFDGILFVPVTHATHIQP